MKINFTSYYLTLFVLFVVQLTVAQTSSLVALNSPGNLVYTPDSKGNIIPEFSGVGYRNSEAPIPDFAVVKTVNAVAGDNLANIQNAINEVSTYTPDVSGFRGAMTFKAGTYNSSNSSKISSSGIALQGEGLNGSGTNSKSAKTFVHPGIFNTKEELDFVKAKIAANEQPWKGAFDRIKNSVDVNYVSKPVVDIIDASTRDAFLNDSDQAYNFALLWYYSGNQIYANKAIEIINGWSIFKTSFKGLDLEWGSSDLIPAAELIEYSNAGWAAADITKFKTMVKTYLIPQINSNKSNLDNRRTTGIRTMLAISVFLDDETLFNTWVADWKYYTPIYVLDNGQCKETCRDQHHVVYGLEGVFQGAETAWIQGVDLYSLEKARLTKFLELFSGWARGTVPIPSDICSSTTDYTIHPGLAPCRNYQGAQYHNPPCLVESNLTFDKVYLHYTKQGVNLPYTLAYNNFYREYWDRKCLQDYIRPVVTVPNDTDNDGVIDSNDNCPNTANPLQEDSNNNGIGDVCETSHYQYPGKIWKIPGIIDARFFDIGGEGKAYHDSNAGLEKTTLVSPRTAAGPEDVEVEATNVGFIKNDEWLKYTVDSVKSGIYTINVNSASLSNTAIYEISLNDNVLASITANATGAWQTYQEFTATNIKIDADYTNAVIKVRFVNTSLPTASLCNFKDFSFVKTADVLSTGFPGIAPSKYFTIVPNPARNTFAINYKNIIIKNVIIRNAIGMKVYEQVVSNASTDNNIVVNVDFAKGIYIVSITDSQNKVYSEKLIIQ